MTGNPKVDGVAELIKVHADGTTNIDLSAEQDALLQKLWNDAQDQGVAQGSLTIKVKYTLKKRGECDVAIDFERKEPKPRRDGAVIFVNKKGEIALAPFKQEKLDFGEPKEAEADEKPPRKIGVVK